MGNGSKTNCDDGKVNAEAPAARPRGAWFYPLALVFLVLIVFSNAMPDAFPVDDASFAPDPDNPVTFEALLRLFREDAWASSRVSTGVYRPISMATILLESLLHGPAGTGFHATNVLFHVLATLAVYALYLAILVDDAGRRGLAAGSAWPGAFAGALVFGVHPIHTEAVDSIFNRSEILATAAVVGGLIVILRHGETRPRFAWAAAAGIYFVGLLCKESAVMLPVLAALLLAVLRPGPTLRETLYRLRPLAWLAIPLGVYLLLRFNALSGFTATATQSLSQAHQVGSTPGERLALVVASLRDFLRMMVWPHPLRASYDDYVASGVAGAAGLLLLLAILCVALRRRTPALLLGLGFFYLALLPSTRLVSHHGVVVTLAERYTYLPSVGFTLLLAFAGAAVARRAGSVALYGATAVVAVPLSILTFQRNEQWHSDLALWSAEVAAAPENADGWKWLTAAHLNEGRIADAVAVCDEHGKKFAANAALQVHCGGAYARAGRFADAERAFLAAVASNPASSIAHKNLARFYLGRGRFAEAERAYRASVENELDEVRRHVNRGEMLLRLYPDRIDEAEAEYRAALAIEPRFGSAQQGMAEIRRRRAER